jgi:zinc transport system ATP-binding protein
MGSPAVKPDPLISIENISFGYDSIKVLSGVTLAIYPGDFLALIGPNGSGKTTLLKIMLGLLKPSTGNIHIMGKPLFQFKNWEKIGYVPQKATNIDPFFPVAVKEVVDMGLINNKKGVNLQRDKKQIEEALVQVDMLDFYHRRIGNLSAGQQQRVFIARAIVNKPKILILDEPTTGVDAVNQGYFYDMLDNLNKKRGISIVLVTHETGIINRHFTQVACLNQKLIYHGSHEEFCQSEAFRKMLAEGHHVISHRH